MFVNPGFEGLKIVSARKDLQVFYKLGNQNILLKKMFHQPIYIKMNDTYKL